MLARKKRAAIVRKRKALQPKEIVVQRISLKDFVRTRLDQTRRSSFVPMYTHRSSDDEISRPLNAPCNTSRIDRMMYTGDKLLGIAVMHKSCLVPIFSQEEAESVAKMRRN